MAASTRGRRPSVRERRLARQAAPPSAPPPNPPLDRRTAAVGIAVVAAAAIVYALTAARDFVVGDTAELAAAALTLGVAHPPGYPLLVLLGHAFSWLPVGPAAFRVNLLAVVASAATVGIVYLTAYRLVGDRLPAALAALLLAFNPLFWAWSLVFEAFPLNNLLAAAMVYLLVLWRERPERGWLVVAAALIAGLGLSNHQTIVLLGPAVLFLLWDRRQALLARPWLMACAPSRSPLA